MNQFYYQQLQKKVLQIGYRPVDVLIVGATGTGKSSTLNALFGDELSPVGEGINPVTKSLNHYMLNDLMRFWDSPGLGDSEKNDKEYSKLISKILQKTYLDDNNIKCGIIDMVLVILNGSSKDMGTVFELLEQVILKNIHPNRIIISINQADMAKKGRNWDISKQQPDEVLIKFLEEKTQEIRSRILQSTGLHIIHPIWYSATANFNIDKLLDSIIQNLPPKKRIMT